MRREINKILFAVLALVMAGTMQMRGENTTFNPGKPWLDTDGQPINAHGGNIVFYNNLYYWYGEHRTETVPGCTEDGMACYTSEDLLNWKNQGLVLTPTNKGDFLLGCLMERPKVVYNKKTKKFVMLFHMELKGQGYRAARVAFAESKQPLGPFRFIRSLRPNAGKWPADFTRADIAKAQSVTDLKDLTEEQKEEAVRNGFYLNRDLKGGQMSRDMTVYIDDDGKAYHIFASEENQTLHIAELTKDFLDYTGRYARVDAGGSNEAPCIFKVSGTYWMITSGCTGWAPNRARMFSAKSIFGPWTKYDTPFTGKGFENTFGGQGCFILRDYTQKEGYIFMGDMWNANQLSISRHFWLPINMKDGKPEIPWLSGWCFAATMMTY